MVRKRYSDFPSELLIIEY